MLYWPLVDAAGPDELLAHRVVWSLLFCLVFGVALRRWRELWALLRRPVVVGLLAVASVALTVAWGVYIHAVNTDRVVESSLGLYLIPLSTALVGVAVFGERLRPLQWVAVGGAAGATVVVAVGYGRPPWIALALCGLMAVYALVKKRAAAPAVAGFTVECLVATPVALAYVGWLAATGHGTVGVLGWRHTALVVASGLMTAVPLIAHAATINLLPLAVVGVLQYLNPTLQFLLGALVLDEPVGPARWAGFAAIWVALLVFAVDQVRGAGVGAVEERGVGDRAGRVEGAGEEPARHHREHDLEDVGLGKAVPP